MKPIIIFFVWLLIGCTNRNPPQNKEFVNNYGNADCLTGFNPKQYICYRSTNTIVLDGKSDDMGWQMIPWNIEFCDILGDNFLKPSYLTRAKLLWDQDFLYVAAEMKESHLRSAANKGDLLNDNCFSIFIDVNGDAGNYLEVTITTDGFWDIKSYKTIDSEGVSWSAEKKILVDAVVHLEGTLNDPTDEDHYWSIEVALPINSLIGEYQTFRPETGIQWRMNFTRIHWNAIAIDGFYKKEIDSETGKIYPQEKWVWSPLGVMNEHRPELWGFVQFSDVESGHGHDLFVYDADEDVKWELRNIFYAQKRYFELEGQYAGGWRDLKKVGFNKEALSYEPEMDRTDTGFQVTALSLSKTKTFRIDQTGLIFTKEVNSIDR